MSDSAASDIIGFHHPGLVVPDLDGARAFYARAFGFEYIRSYGWGSESSDTAEKVIGVADSTTRSMLMKCGNCFLELFQFDSPASRGNPSERRACDFGVAHIAFQVSNIERVFDRFIAAGGSSGNRPVRIGEGKSIYARDPFGNIIELMEIGSDEPDFDLKACNMLPTPHTTAG